MGRYPAHAVRSELFLSADFADSLGAAFGRNQDYLSLRRKGRKEDKRVMFLSLSDLCVFAREINSFLPAAYEGAAK